jgi:hypothetical protein
MFVTQKDFSLQAREVIREFVKGPYLLLRVAVKGPYFPLRDSAPFVRIISGHNRAESLMAVISPDQKELRGYFPIDTKVAGRVEFGYASQVIGSIGVRRIETERLESRRIHPGVRRVTSRHLLIFKQQR